MQTDARREFTAEQALVLALCCAAVAAVAFAWGEGGVRLPVWIASAVLFGLPLVLFPRCRPRLSMPLCPHNLALALFFVQLVAVPVSIMIWGVARGQLPDLPSNRSLTLASLLSMLAYASFCLGNERAGAHSEGRHGVPDPWEVPRWLPALCLVIGAAGMVATFPSLSGLVEYYTHPAMPDAGSAGDGPASLRGAAGTFLRPFLAFGAIALWARWLDRRRTRSLLTALAATGACLAFEALSNLSFHYNRAAVVYPALAILGTFSLRVRRLSLRTLAALALTAVLVLALVGSYRSSSFTVADVFSEESVRASLLERTDLNSTLQVYGSAPQLNAYLLDGTGWGDTLYWGRTLAASALYPVPVLGKPFRESSGVALFNRLIYANESLDQVIPFTGELFLNFHVVGVIAGFALLGWAVAALQARFERACRALDAYICLFTGLWLSSLILSSVAAVGQIFVYMFWPIYGYLIVRAAARRKKRAAFSYYSDEKPSDPPGHYRPALS